MRFIFFINFFILHLCAVDLQHLSQDPYWKLLLHVPQNTAISEIDSPNFFLSPMGQSNPYDELRQTYLSLTNDSNTTDNNSTQCRFPARTKWLEEKTGETFQKKECSDLNKFLLQLDPKKATIIFPTAHISSPASMFGHTLLRIDSSMTSKLTSHAINYAAQADQTTENGVIFAIKGLLGGYYGKFSMLPYYEKLKEYSDTEQRDIWEYQLNLSEHEIHHMLLHIWELKDTYSNYYFFNENCSYNLLWLLEVARPSLNLRANFLYHVSPPETLFVMQQENLIDQIFYRPSKRTKLLAYENNTTTPSKQQMIQLALGEKSASLDSLETFSLEEKQRILEGALELSEYYYIQRIISKKEYLDIFHQLSISRATLGKSEILPITKPKDPLQSHRQFRLSLHHLTTNDKHTNLLGIRPTYHSFLEDDTGLLAGTKIEFLDYLGQIQNNQLSTESFTLLSLGSRTPTTTFFDPLSWEAYFGLNHSTPQNKLQKHIALDLGKTFTLGSNNLTFYLMSEVGTFVSEKYHYLGLKTGTTFDLSPLKLNTEYTIRKFDSFEQQLAHINLHYKLNQNVALYTKFEYISRMNLEDTNSFFIGLHFYY